MTTPLQSSIDTLRLSLQASAGVDVTYTRVSDASETDLVAIPGYTTTETDLGDGIIRQDRLHDFIVNADDLGFEPSTGDTIVHDSRTYEVMNHPGVKAFNEIGPYQQMYRIHTKQVYGS